MQRAASTPPWASPAVIARVVLVVLVVLAAVGLVYVLRQPLVWLFLATFLAIAVSGPVTWFSKYLPRGLAITITYLLMFFVPIGIALAILPGIITGFDSLLEGAPDYAAKAQAYVQGSDLLRGLETDYRIFSSLKERLSDAPAMLGNVASWLGDLGLGVVNSGFAVVNVVLMSIFIVGGGPRWSRAFLASRPPEQAARLERVFSGIGNTVGNYVMGAVGQAFVAALTTYIVLVILDVPFAVGLAAITFVLDLIPLVGATIAGVLVGIFTLFVGFPTSTIVWAIWAIVYQQIENNLIQPQIQRRAVAIEPLVVLVSVLCGAAIAGVLGAVLAIPVAASIQLVIREWRAYSAEDGAGAAAPTADADPPAPDAEPKPA